MTICTNPFIKKQPLMQITQFNNKQGCKEQIEGGWGRHILTPAGQKGCTGHVF